MTRKRNIEREKVVYEAIIEAGQHGISTTDLAKKLNLKRHNVKHPMRWLHAEEKVCSSIYLGAIKSNGEPDARSIRHVATIYKSRLALNRDHLQILNKIRIGRKINEVGKQ